MNAADPADAELPMPEFALETDGPSRPYRRDPTLVAVLAQLADSACEGAADPHDASCRVEQLAEQMTPPVEHAAVLMLFNTFHYTLRPEKVPQAGAALTPMDGPSLLPVPLHAAPGDMRDAWLALASEVTHPVARARLYDIVFTLGLVRNGRQAAEQAARAYLDGVGGDQRPQAQATGVVRAWTLTRKVGSAALEDEVIKVMLDMVGGMVDREEYPYAVIPMLCALSTPPRGAKAEAVDPRVDEVLDRALLTYLRPRVLKDITAIVRKHAASDAARVETANRTLIEAMLAEARAATEPMVIRVLFGETASMARRLGVADLEKVAVAALQSAPALTWDSTAYSIDLPASFFDMYLPGFNEATDWREALIIWLHTDSPSGRYETNVATTRQALLKEGSVHQSLPTVVFRDGDLPARTLSGEDEKFSRELAHVELLYIGTYGMYLADALDMIDARFGIPPREELEAFLCSSGGDAALMNVLATALQLFWVAEYDAAVHLAVPKIEAAARALLLELNEPVYRTEVGNASGQFSGLGALLPLLLDNGFDSDWARFLGTLLLGNGSNVRNLAAHGFLHKIDPLNTAAVLRALAVLALITSEPAVQRDAATVKAALVSPAGTRPPRSWRQRIFAAALAAWYELRRG